MTDSIADLLLSSFNFSGLLGLCLTTFATACILTPLERRYPAYAQPLFPKTEIVLDLAYWFFTPIASRLFTNLVLLLVVGGGLLFMGRPVDNSIMKGWGPIGAQSQAAQIIEMLLLVDFIDYWTHRTFHSFTKLWRFHAVHHASEQMSWLSANRVHPINDLVTRIFQVVPLVVLGFSAEAIVMVIPYIVFYVMFLHANISWDFGPFRWLLVSPAYHRWHHTSDREGLDKNFAGVFPIWDLLFGTAYFPKKLLLRRYGIAEKKLPRSFRGQILFPFLPE